MKSTKWILSPRVVIATIMGLLGGGISIGFINMGMGPSLPPAIALRMVLSFGLMGFAIGTSALPWHWSFHGLFFGLIIGLIEGLASVVMGFPLIIPLIFCAVYGVLIELVTTVVFKAGAPRGVIKA
jgi:hypothetical protein